MKTIDDYIIYCTEAQAKKALGLGAPIEFEQKFSIDWKEGKRIPYPDVERNENGEPILIPVTAEQMIGWLRTKGCTPYVYPVRRDGKSVLSARLLINLSTDMNSDSFCGFGEDYSIILSAIDAALKYLSDNNLIK